MNLRDGKLGPPCISAFAQKLTGYPNMLGRTASEIGWPMPGIGMFRAIVTGEHLFHSGRVTTLRRWVRNGPKHIGILICIFEVVCVGSVAELERLSGVQGIADIHREKIDHITIPSQKGNGRLKRVEEVFDCWFESGR